MTTSKLLEIAARLFTEHGPRAEVYAPIMLTAADVIDRTGDVPLECRELAKAYVEAELRGLVIDTPDEIVVAGDRVIEQAAQSIRREWRR